MFLVPSVVIANAASCSSYTESISPQCGSVGGRVGLRSGEWTVVVDPEQPTRCPSRPTAVCRWAFHTGFGLERPTSPVGAQAAVLLV